MFDIAEFSSVIAQNGIQRSTLFSVQMGVPAGLQNQTQFSGAFNQDVNTLQFFVEECPLPGAQLATIKNRRHGYGPVEDAPFAVVFEPILMRFLGDGNMIIWNYLYTWFQYICNFNVLSTKSLITATGTMNSSGSNQYPYEMNYRKDFAVDITITTYNQQGQSTAQVQLRSAYPRFVAPVPFNWADRNGIMRIPVEFSYLDWANLQNPYSGSTGGTLDIGGAIAKTVTALSPSTQNPTPSPTPQAGTNPNPQEGQTSVLGGGEFGSFGP